MESSENLASCEILVVTEDARRHLSLQQTAYDSFISQEMYLCL